MWHSSYLAIGISPKWNRTFTEFRNHCNMNLDQFNDPLCYLCLYARVVASLSLTQEKAVLNTAILLVQQYILSLSSTNSVKTFRENSNISDEKCDRIISGIAIEFRWTGRFCTSLFCEVPVRLLTNWYKMFQLIKVPACQQTSWYSAKWAATKCSSLCQIWHKLEHFAPACQKFQFVSKRTGTRQNELVQNVPKLNLNLNLSEWRYTMKKGNTIKMRKASSLWRSKMILNYTSQRSSFCILFFFQCKKKNPTFVNNLQNTYRADPDCNTACQNTLDPSGLNVGINTGNVSLSHLVQE